MNSAPPPRAVPEPRSHDLRGLGFWGALLVAAWLGLAAGLLEVGAKLACAAIGWHGHFYQMSRHFLWLIPVTNLLIFLSLGLLLAPFAWLFPRVGRWATLRLLGGLAMLPMLLILEPGIYTAAWLVVGLGLAARGALLVECRWPAARKFVVRSFPVLVLMVVALAGWVFGRDRLRQARESSRALPAAQAPNILLVVMDTVRADHLSAYGYGRRTTPTLEWLGDRGLIFTQARSTAPWTLASHAGMFTGRLPGEVCPTYLTPLKLGPGTTTLAAYLGSRGYATAGFVANVLYCGYDTGLAEGFTHYEDYNLPHLDAFLMARLADRALNGFFLLAGWLHQNSAADMLAPVERFVQNHVVAADVHSRVRRKDAATINRGFFDWLTNRPEPSRPFFAFLNYYDAHTPYLPPRSSTHRFGLRPSSDDDFNVLMDWELLDKPSLPVRLRALAVDCYDDCIRSMDDQFAALFSGLEQRGLLENTLVVVTADHGEGFGEHDLFVHAESLYRPEIHVPLIVRSPATSPRPVRGTVNSLVSLRDLPATIADLAGLKDDAPFPGSSLAGLSGDQALAEAAAAELSTPDPTDPNQGRSPARLGPLSALLQGRYCYIRRDGQVKEELYDEFDDSRQARDLSGEERMKPVMDGFRKDAARIFRPR